MVNDGKPLWLRRKEREDCFRDGMKCRVYQDNVPTMTHKGKQKADDPVRWSGEKKQETDELCFMSLRLSKVLTLWCHFDEEKDGFDSI